jgi:dTMP kinase
MRLSGVRVPDKFEAQPAAFFAKVRAGYLARSLEQGARFATIDAGKSREVVRQAVYGAVQSRGWLP